MTEIITHVNIYTSLASLTMVLIFLILFFKKNIINDIGELR